MATWDSYTQKSTPADADTLMIKDTSGGSNKRTPFSGVWNWIVSKLTSAVISQLNTSSQNVIGAINELNSKTLRRTSVGLISKGDKQYYASETIQQALQEAYNGISDTRVFDGVLYASRVNDGSSDGANWCIDGFKSSSNYGYITITTYLNNMESHTYLLAQGSWSWIS